MVLVYIQLYLFLLLFQCNKSARFFMSFLQDMFHVKLLQLRLLPLFFVLLQKSRPTAILIVSNIHACRFFPKCTPVSGIDSVFSFVIFNPITSPRAASIRCFMTAVFPFNFAYTGSEYLSFSSFLEIETAYFDVSTVSVIMISEDISTFCNVTLSPCFKDVLSVLLRNF